MYWDTTSVFNWSSLGKDFIRALMPDFLKEESSLEELALGLVPVFLAMYLVAFFLLILVDPEEEAAVLEEEEEAVPEEVEEAVPEEEEEEEEEAVLEVSLSPS